MRPLVAATVLASVVVSSADVGSVAAAGAQQVGAGPCVADTTVLGASGARVDLGGLTDHLFVFTDGSIDANWQAASPGYIGDVAVDGLQASERSSGNMVYRGTIYTNAGSLDGWQEIVDNNPGRAQAALNETARLTQLEADLDSAFAQINALTPTGGFASRSSSSLDGATFENGRAETIVINVTSELSFSNYVNIRGDESDLIVMRWDTDGNPNNGYQGQVKLSSGGAIVPQGGLTPGNFVHVAGVMDSSGGGTTPPPPYPQGPGDVDPDADDFNSGGYFTGYWLTTGDPVDRQNGSFSNGNFVGGWYSSTTKFSMTSGTSGLHVCPPNVIAPTYICVSGTATGQTTATLVGRTTDPAATQARFVLAGGPGTVANDTTFVAPDRTFESNATGLTANTNYTFQVEFLNNNGTVVGTSNNNCPFTTQAIPPTYVCVSGTATGSDHGDADRPHHGPGSDAGTLRPRRRARHGTERHHVRRPGSHVRVERHRPHREHQLHVPGRVPRHQRPCDRDERRRRMPVHHPGDPADLRLRQRHCDELDDCDADRPHDGRERDAGHVRPRRRAGTAPTDTRTPGT